jgi:hypothetical protein
MIKEPLLAKLIEVFVRQFEGSDRKKQCEKAEEKMRRQKMEM